MSSKLKKFDVHSKAVDGVNEQTAIGALVTFIMYGFIGFLLYSEVSVRSDSDIVSRMVLDASGSARRIQTTKIEFDVDFHKIACDRIQFTQEVTRGEHHGDPTKTDAINLVPMVSENIESCHVFGTLVTDKVGGNFRFEIAELESEAKAIAAAKDTSPEAMEARRILFPGGPESPIMVPPDISHKINHILFLENHSNGIIDQVASGAAYDNMLKLESRPLNGQDCQVPLGIGIHQYSIQVVPTTYMSYKEEPKHLNQYSVTERQVEFEQALSGVMIGGQPFTNFVGVVFNYDFYPVRILLGFHHLIFLFFADFQSYTWNLLIRRSWRKWNQIKILHSSCVHDRLSS